MTIKERCLIERKGECILKDETLIVLAVSAFTGLTTALIILNAPIINKLKIEEISK